MKSNINFRDQSWNRYPQNVGFYFISIMPRIFIEDSSEPKHPKNVKSTNNTMGNNT